MKIFILPIAAMLLLTVAMVAADQTWTGQISDSLCLMKHQTGEEQGEKLSDPDCTRACVRGGSKYVFILDGKAYQIANQENPDLEKLAGLTVKLTGEMKGQSITVAKIEASAK